ncbi:hypothetical protein HD806DRAFT_439148 [Xylariaceae sp. AK1471]|nr:hypothetical protein HD806DRAFT_439148 [Xylariaceae sp. AK1471]
MMKTLASLILLGQALAFQLPENATIVPVKYSGSGCPIISSDRRTSVVDYMFATFLENDDKTDYVATYALNLPPTMGAAVWGDSAAERTRSCTHEWKFVNSDGWRLNLHKNGTEIIARYRLTEDLSAVWDVTYYPPEGTEITDSITVAGPIGSQYSSGQPELPKERQLSSNPSKSWKTGCTEAEHVVKIKTEVSLVGDGKQWGQVWGGYENEFYNRIMQTLSYSWEKCD